MARKVKTKEPKCSHKVNQKAECVYRKGTLWDAFCTWAKLLDMFPSTIIWLSLVVYRSVVGRLPLFLEKIDTLKKSNHSKETEIEQLKSLIERKDKESRVDKEKELDLRQLKNVIESKDKESKLKSKMIKSLEDEVNQMNHNLKTKVTENAELEAEKKETLRRLNEQVSIKLRDNNPNVVDLKDPCRPTKLAEMFISKGRAEESWQILRDWFLDESLPGAKLTTKWLKDSRKINVKRKVSEIGTDFKEKDFKVYLSRMCGDYKVKTFLSDGAIDTYLLKCIELCLLMVSTDPPVVLACPGWESTHTLHIHDTNMEESYLNERREGQICVAENWSTDDRNVKQQKLYEQHIQSGREEQKAIPEKSLTGRKNAIERGKTQKLTEQRVSFDKELFKKYTSRGNYIDYVVWPAMLLHTDGPLLRKGIAQGT